MAVNQSQVDHIITAASEDDPEVKLQNLEREVDLIKTSIKRLLMDIRERMNEMENPLSLTASGSPGAGADSLSANAGEAKKSALEAREAALDARESQMEAEQAKMETESRNETPPVKAEPVSPQVAPAVTPPANEERKMLDEQMFAALRSQMGALSKNTPAVQTPASEKLRLQKVYKLFKWTHESVKKYGHDRLEIILESYRVMGYISKESSDEIREISRLMPANLGEEHEVGPDEFVAELYSLNRILVPNDTSLDRDMIEVMMEQRQQSPATKNGRREEKIDLSGIPARDKKSSEKEKDEEWMNLPDRI
ncbi:MAG: hypothetical protein ABSB80_11890 [Methanoregula sp.]|jgi:hypothetical protein|uniref:hypothetical protein n=1 Tax=Methanoregula sp. TaxID=2052170 RepID=UPI003D0B30F1